ncbi:helix-hairpin-helix domain-containing protein [Promicromonospora thailandica]|uniref:Competence protein ComEA n=1 Tax=Promicromonospora thailandica TaxID=765201 RepID=A0A9X2JUN5_9MICO|nr:helix-hairpin-helix domain-containing protein [Promicromonospora thailandica]MCP2264211.1 competence protein ComEA [Promicromonospora thailandica]
MQPDTASRPPSPWPFSPVLGATNDATANDATANDATTNDATMSHGTTDGATPDGATPGDAVPDDPGRQPPWRAEAPGAEAHDDTDALVARLRARRSATGVAAAYAAAHGHPADPRAEQGTRRWALTGTTAAVAVVSVLLLGLVVAALSLGGDGVVPVAAGDSTPGPGATEASATGASALPAGTARPPAAEADTAGGPAQIGADLLVHVVGAVRKPGLVTVPAGARVADALRAAGGPTDAADLTVVNLARTVTDGEQLYVPEPGEAPPGPGTPPAAGPGPGSGTGGAVDINTADAAALEALPGVGPSIAQAIVEWRETNGPFASVDELEDVPGIGPATLDEIRDSARVGP